MLKTTFIFEGYRDANINSIVTRGERWVSSTDMYFRVNDNSKFYVSKWYKWCPAIYSIPAGYFEIKGKKLEKIRDRARYKAHIIAARKILIITQMCDYDISKLIVDMVFKISSEYSMRCNMFIAEYI